MNIFVRLLITSFFMVIMASFFKWIYMDAPNYIVGFFGFISVILINISLKLDKD